MGNISGDTTGFRKAIVSEDIFPESPIDLDKELIDEMKGIYTELSKSEEIDESLKIRIAKACLKMMEEAPLDKEEVMERAFELSKFVEYEYDDALDSIFEKAAKLSPPEFNTDDFIFGLWNEMKEELEEYLDSR